VVRLEQKEEPHTYFTCEHRWSKRKGQRQLSIRVTITPEAGQQLALYFAEPEGAVESTLPIIRNLLVDSLRLIAKEEWNREA